MQTLPTPPRGDAIVRGIMFMIASTVAFGGVNALVKWEVADYPVGEVAFFRSVFSLIPCAILVLPRQGPGVLRTARIGDHIRRALSQGCSMLMIFVAFKLMPLASVIAISFSAPLFTTLLSVVLLKEKVGIHRWSALGIGFCGVLLVTDPGADSLSVGALFALGNALLFSTVAIAIRRMSTTETPETMLAWQLIFLSIFTAALLPFDYVTPSLFDAALLALAGMLNGVAQYWWTKSLHLAPASAVVPFNYLSLIWASIVGFFVWGDVPTPMLAAGSAIVVGSSLYILWRETGARRKQRAPA